MGDIFNFLPYETHLLWISYLTPAEICTVGKLSSFFNEISHDDYVWKHWCKQHFLIKHKDDTEKEEGETEIYKRMFLSFGKYISCYARVKKTWNQIERWLAAYSPSTLASLRPGLSTEATVALEEKVDIPLEYLCSLSIHDGQEDNKVNSFSLFGFCSAYDYAVSMRMIQAQDFIVAYTHAQAHEPHTPWMQYVIPIAASTLDSYVYFLVIKDFQDGPNPFQFKRGMILDHTTRDPVVLANSFMEFFENFGNDLIKGKYDVVSNRIVMISSLAQDGSDVTTRGVRVRANALFMPQRSSFDFDNSGSRQNESYFFIYRIRISMSKDEDQAKSAKLESRYWRIVNGNNQSDVVSGPGVIGLYPRAYPGSYFEYCSCTTQETLRGYMEGSFVFTLKSTGEKFDVEVGRFPLIAR